MTEEWISISEWQQMIHRSQFLLNTALFYKVIDPRYAERSWAELQPLNRRIRSPLLKVRGIDDRVPDKSLEAAV